MLGKLPTNFERKFVAMDEFTSLNAGLDALEIQKKTARNWRSKFSNFTYAIIAFVTLLVIWQVAIKISGVKSYILPSPKQVFSAMQTQWKSGILPHAIFRSFSRGVEGYALALLVATPLGLLLGLNKGLRMVIGPVLLGLQQLPSVAWVPAAIIWFGLSPATIFAVVLLGAVPSIANGLISGIDQIPPLYLKVASVLRANKWQRIRHFILPAAWPGYLAGLEQGWAFAWRSLMAAELIAVSPSLGLGVGQLLDVGRQLGDMSLVIGTIFVIMAIGIFVEKIFFSPLRKRTLRNRGLTQN